MIKIDLSQYDIQKIEECFLTDMKNRNTGLFQILNQNTVRKLLKNPQYRKLYCFFYNANGNIQKDNVRNLLLADRKNMKKYINDLGEFSDSESKKLLKTVFKYDTFSSCKCAYDILQIEDVTVCPYCNRQYVFTLHKKRVRPQFDHFYPKSKYPYLALSIFNLIPCCSICNQAKSSLDTFENPILYPFEEEFGDKVRFKIDGTDFRQWQGITDDFEVIIDDEKICKDKRRKVEKQNEQLHLQEFYNQHKDYIKDIAWNHYINTSERINEIMKMFPGMFRTKEDALSVVYMNDVREDRLGKRPLAKLTRDIYNMLENT